MQPSISLLSLLACAASVLAAPTPLHPAARGVPNLHEVIRNPAPINHKCDGIDLGIIKLDLCLGNHHRSVPVLADDAAAVVPVIQRSLPVKMNV
jgi:hypothetical protein